MPAAALVAWATIRAQSESLGAAVANLSFDNKRAQATEGPSGLVSSVPSSECVGNRSVGAASATSVQELYDDLGLRQDSLFELLDAVLTTRAFVKLSCTGEPGLAKRRDSSRMAASQRRTPA